MRKSGQKRTKLQRRLSRKKRGSQNRRKAQAKVAKCHEKIANQRRDFLHRKSYRLVAGHDVIVMEELQVTVPKDRSVRVHKCPRCGLEEDRDVVSAKLILERGLQILRAA